MIQLIRCKHPAFKDDSNLYILLCCDTYISVGDPACHFQFNLQDLYYKSMVRIEYLPQGVMFEFTDLEVLFEGSHLGEIREYILENYPGELI